MKKDKFKRTVLNEKEEESYGIENIYLLSFA